MAEVDISSIIWPEDRRRKFVQKNVETIKDSIDTEGLKVPLIVRRNKDGQVVGVAGLHRWTAMSELGIERCRVEFQPDEGDDELNQISDAMTEIDENLARQPLTPIEEGLSLVERECLLIQRSRAKEKTNHGSQSGRRSRDAVQQATREAQKALGVGPRPIQQRKQESRTLIAIAEQVGVHPIDLSGSSLDKRSELRCLVRLVKKSEERARRVVKAAADGKFVSAKRELREAERFTKETRLEAERETEAGRYRQLALAYDAVLEGLTKAKTVASELGISGNGVDYVKRACNELKRHRDGCKKRAQLLQ